MHWLQGWSSQVNKIPCGCRWLLRGSTLPTECPEPPSTPFKHNQQAQLGARTPSLGVLDTFAVTLCLLSQRLSPPPCSHSSLSSCSRESNRVWDVHLYFPVEQTLALVMLLVLVLAFVDYCNSNVASGLHVQWLTGGNVQHNQCHKLCTLNSCWHCHQLDPVSGTLFPHLPYKSRPLKRIRVHPASHNHSASHQAAILQGGNTAVAPATTTSTALPLHRHPHAPIQQLALRLEGVVPGSLQVRCCLQGRAACAMPTYPRGGCINNSQQLPVGPGGQCPCKQTYVSNNPSATCPSISLNAAVALRPAPSPRHAPH